MKSKASNKNLHGARSAKKDEFYTQLTDIEKELKHYKSHFRGKTVFCNCDDPVESNFWQYFSLNFEHLGLKKLISTHYEEDQPSYKLEITADRNRDGKINGLDRVRTPLKQNGDFRSPECVEIMQEADIVVTNPPFSLFREYVAQLVAHKKKFLVIGNLNAITYKEIFPLIKDNLLWFGATMFNGGAAYFIGDSSLYDPEKMSNPKNAYVKDGKLYWRVNGVRWYTNLKHKKRYEDLILYRKYNPKEYPTYDNYDAINVDKVKDIPYDYAGAIGVPISFLDKYNPEQFEIMSANDIRSNDNVPFKKHGLIKDKDGSINGKAKYARIVIRNRNPQQEPH